MLFYEKVRGAVSFHLGSFLSQLFDIGNANIWMTMAPLNPTLLDIDYQLINKSSSITIRHLQIDKKLLWQNHATGIIYKPLTFRYLYIYI